MLLWLLSAALFAAAVYGLYRWAKKDGLFGPTPPPSSDQSPRGHPTGNPPT